MEIHLWINDKSGEARFFIKGQDPRHFPRSQWDRTDGSTWVDKGAVEIKKKKAKVKK